MGTFRSVLDKALLTSKAEGVWELDGLEDSRVFVDTVHVEDGSGATPGVCEELSKLGPGQDGVPQQNLLRHLKH